MAYDGQEYVNFAQHLLYLNGALKILIYSMIKISAGNILKHFSYFSLET